jgi:hypothetical protein
MKRLVTTVILGWVAAGCGSAVFYEEVPDDAPDAWVEGPRHTISVDDAPDESCPARIARSRAEVLLAIESALARHRTSESRCLGRHAKVLSTMHAASLGAGFEDVQGETMAIEHAVCEPLPDVIARARACR